MEETKKAAQASAASNAQHTDCEDVAAEEITVPGPHDVLMGRGAPLSEHVGNQRLRQHVMEVRDAYAASSTHAAKRQIAISVLAAVSARGGRFLRKRVKGAESTRLPGTWGIVEDQAELLHKVKQLLRDMKPEAQARRAQRKRQWIAKQTSTAAASSPERKAVTGTIPDTSVEQRTDSSRIGQPIHPLTQVLAYAPSTSVLPQGLAATLMSTRENLLLLRSLQQPAQQLVQQPGVTFSFLQAFHESRHPQSLFPLSLPIRNEPSRPILPTATSIASVATDGPPPILAPSLRQALLSSLVEAQQGHSTGGVSLPPLRHVPTVAQPSSLWPFVSPPPGLRPGIPWGAAANRTTTNLPVNDPLLDLLVVQQGWQTMSPVERLRLLEELQASSRPR